MEGVSKGQLAKLLELDAELVRWGHQGGLLRQLQRAIDRGKLMVAAAKEHRLIDCQGELFWPERTWSYRSHEQVRHRIDSEEFIWDHRKAKLSLVMGQGGTGFTGHSALVELDQRPPYPFVLPAQVLDHLLKFQEITRPGLRFEMDEKVVFWGTIYRDGEGKECVRYMCRQSPGQLYGSGYLRLEELWPGNLFALTYELAA